jgi:hypothetical protein
VRSSAVGSPLALRHGLFETVPRLGDIAKLMMNDTS